MKLELEKPLLEDKKNVKTTLKLQGYIVNYTGAKRLKTTLVIMLALKDSFFLCHIRFQRANNAIYDFIFFARNNECYIFVLKYIYFLF